MISAILLAAGESRRMGQLKQLLPLGSNSVIETCLETLLASKVDEVIVVLGHRYQDVQQRIDHLPVKIAINQGYQLGMSSSVKCGVAAASPLAHAVLVALVDQPLVTADIIDRLIDGYAAQGKKIVIPAYQGRGGHPILLDAAYREAILELDPNRGLRQVLYAHPEETLKLAVETDVVVQNMNTWDDYQRTVIRFSATRTS